VVVGRMKATWQQVSGFGTPQAAGPKGRHIYSRGQAKPTNLISQQGRYLEPGFFQILVPIC